MEKAGVDPTDSGLHQTLHSAILKENLSSISVQDNWVNSPLHMGRPTLSLKDHASFPLHLSASHRKVESLKMLLDSGANPEVRDQQGRNTLHLVITNWPNMAIKWQDSHAKFGCKMAAMEQRAEACLKVLCDFGVDPNARVNGNCHETALHLAVRYAALPAVGLLASHGAHVNMTDTFGMMPLHLAASVLNTGITSSLLQLGADVNSTVRQSGNTALHLAVSAAMGRIHRAVDSDLSCISELLKLGALPNVVNRVGYTPLHEACQGGREAVVDLLLKHGADMNKLTTSGENCLFLFLTQRLNLKHTSLLGKLLHLTSPMTITNKQGLFPHILTLPEYSKQRNCLMHLSQQPRDLLSICKIHLNQQCSDNYKSTLKGLLPKLLYDYVFNYWDCPSDVRFSGDSEHNQVSSPLHFSPNISSSQPNP